LDGLLVLKSDIFGTSIQGNRIKSSEHGWHPAAFPRGEKKMKGSKVDKGFAIIN
jgi:hypothetical protein